MKRNRIAAWLTGCLLFIASALIYSIMQSRGFPDGYLTELDRAEKVPAGLFIGVSIPAGLWLVFLGWSAGQHITAKFRLTLLLYVLFALLLSGIDLYLRQHLDKGGGG